MNSDATHESLLRHHCGPPLLPSDLAARCNLTLTELAAWLRSDKAKDDLAAIRAGIEMNNQIFISQHRGLAAARLVDIAADDEGADETRRRAAKDLLMINVVELPPQPKPPPAEAVKPELRDPFSGLPLSAHKDPRVNAIMQDAMRRVGQLNSGHAGSFHPDYMPPSTLPANTTPTTSGRPTRGLDGKIIDPGDPRCARGAFSVAVALILLLLSFAFSAGAAPRRAGFILPSSYVCAPGLLSSRALCVGARQDKSCPTSAHFRQQSARGAWVG